MVFEFSESGDFLSNLTEYGEYLENLDESLGAYLTTLVPDFDDIAPDTAVIWDELLEKIDGEPGENSETSEGHSEFAATQYDIGGSPAQSGPSGWFLTGVSVEGFRGINNYQKPLELKFDSQKVNSISAVNGVGKSSLFDAIRYAIRGRLDWLEDLPATEDAEKYYGNKFHPTGETKITLKLVAENTGDECEITVNRDPSGERTISATADWTAEEILRDLDREFVFLDASTFQGFIEAKPLERGRTFSGLLGLSRYSNVRQGLLALSNTRAFSNHFDETTLILDKIREGKNIEDLKVKISQDFEILTGSEPAPELTNEDAKQFCHNALAQIAPISAECVDKTFLEIDVEKCLQLIESAEGGTKRTRLAECISELSNLQTLTSQAPDDVGALKITIFSKERDDALLKTSGDKMLYLFRAGMEVFGLDSWQGPNVCPLCDHSEKDNTKDRVEQKLKEFDALEKVTTAMALDWEEAGWSDFIPYENLLEIIPENRIGTRLESKGIAGEITSLEASQLLNWRKSLRERASKLHGDLTQEQAELEREIPKSLVEVTKKIEAVRRLQESWSSLQTVEDGLLNVTERLSRVKKIKSFLDQATKVFGKAESELSKARLAAVEPVFKDYFQRMAFAGVVPSVNKVGNKEDLQIKVEDFYGLSGLSPQALLSESFRNAFAISLYLAAASLFGGKPRFIILDDVTSSFDAGHQNFLVELVRTSFARPGCTTGPQVILLSHDTMLEKLFNKHGNSGGWKHQRLEGNPKFLVLPQAGAVNKVKDHTIAQLQAGQVDSAKEGVRQYLEYRLSELISKLQIPVPVAVAFTDTKQLSSEFLNAIDAAVKLHSAAGSLVLESSQVSGLNTNMATFVGNFLSHWGTGQTLSFSGPALLGVMNEIDSFCDCFSFEPTSGAPRVYYKTLSQRS